MTYDLQITTGKVKMLLPAAPLLLLLLLAVVPRTKGGVAKDPSAHVATEEQLVMRSPDGGVRFVP